MKTKRINECGVFDEIKKRGGGKKKVVDGVRCRRDCGDGDRRNVGTNGGCWLFCTDDQQKVNNNASVLACRIVGLLRPLIHQWLRYELQFPGGGRARRPEATGAPRGLQGHHPHCSVPYFTVLALYLALMGGGRK